MTKINITGREAEVIAQALYDLIDVAYAFEYPQKDTIPVAKRIREKLNKVFFEED